MQAFASVTFFYCRISHYRYMLLIKNDVQATFQSEIYFNSIETSQISNVKRMLSGLFLHITLLVSLFEF